jgi:hypothetical protein
MAAGVTISIGSADHQTNLALNAVPIARSMLLPRVSLSHLERETTIGLTGEGRSFAKV